MFSYTLEHLEFFLNHFPLTQAVSLPLPVVSAICIFTSKQKYELFITRKSISLQKDFRQITKDWLRINISSILITCLPSKCPAAQIPSNWLWFHCSSSLLQSSHTTITWSLSCWPQRPFIPTPRFQITRSPISQSVLRNREFLWEIHPKVSQFSV